MTWWYDYYNLSVTQKTEFTLHSSTKADDPPVHSNST